MSRKDQIRLAAEADLETFIKLIHPQRVLGHVHSEVISWWNRPEAKTHQLLLLPRDHQKSALIAYRVAWEITKNPAIRILYISSTSNLAQKQLKFIKDILTSDTYTYFWPLMVNKEESKREKWTESEISVDHPKRKQEIVRDPTIFTAGLTTSIVGLHCDISVLDDVVVHDNSKDELSREKVRTQTSYLASIAGTDSRLWAVGTRYDPKDLYNDYINMSYDIFDDYGNIIETQTLFEVFERQVESIGDGSGEYLWPRQQRQDGKWFGFNQEILSKKRAQYLNQTDFRAQYYNNPNDSSTSTITAEMFQYYDKSHLNNHNGKWYIQDRKLNVFASIDFAFSESKQADYTSIVVIGIDSKNNIFVLDIERFKTNKISEYFEKILKTYNKWNYRKLRAEVSVAQAVIVKDLKENYIRPYGLALSIDEARPTKRKEDRIEATLQPRYNNRQIWHYKAGNCQILEEELVNTRPPHDDVKDALASVIEIAIAPNNNAILDRVNNSKIKNNSFIIPEAHPRFGGY